MTKHKRYMLFSNCLVVKGASRSIIYDLMQFDYSYIPNDLYDILTENNGVIDCNKYSVFYENDPDSLEVFTEYLNFLLDEEYIFLLNNMDETLFPKMNLEFYSPSIISNAVVDINFNSNLPKIINELEKVFCNYIMLRLQKETDIIQLVKTLEMFNESIIFHIQLVVKYHPSFSEESLEKLIEKFSFIYSIIIEETPKDVIVLNDNLRISFKNNIYQESYKKNFLINSKLFTEAQKHNTFYNKKIYIGVDGEIKNSPYDDEVFGNINHNELKKTVTSQDFQKYWNIPKDNILVCKDCEHRYMCIDPRKPIKKDNSEWFFDSDCEYNPYTNEWSEN